MKNTDCELSQTLDGDCQQRIYNKNVMDFQTTKTEYLVLQSFSWVTLSGKLYCERIQAVL